MSKFAATESLEPGRDLDALIAEHVMGWRQHVLPSHPDETVDGIAFAPLWEKDGDVLFAQWGRDGRWHTVYNELPLYSTDIAAVWEVFQKIGPGVGIEFSQYGGDEEEPWTVSRQIGVTKEHLAWGKTAPLAICRAALQFASWNTP